MQPAVGDLPAQVADPHDQLRDGGGAGVHLDPEELRGVHRLAHQGEPLLPAEALQPLQHLALELLQELQRDVEEVAGPAGRVEHAHRAEPLVEVAGVVLRLGHRAAGDQLVEMALHVGPVLAQRLHDHGVHEALHVGPGV